MADGWDRDVYDRARGETRLRPAGHDRRSRVPLPDGGEPTLEANCPPDERSTNDSG